MSADDLIDFVESVSGDAHLAVEERLGDGFVRLKTAEAERRQAKHDIRCVEDVVIEMLRNARDAHATSIFLATSREGRMKTLAFLDDGDGIPIEMHERVFEPRVTSKLETMVMDKWGVHGRGMALYSIKANTLEACVIASGPQLGSSLGVRIDLDALPEKTDQSSLPVIGRDEEGSTAIVSGPHNVNRTVAEFALDLRDEVDVFLGSPAEIVATLVDWGRPRLAEMRLLFCDDIETMPLTLRPAAAADATELVELSARLGLDVSERTAHRILAGQIAPLEPFLDQLLEHGRDARTTKREVDLYRDRRGLRLSEDDLGSFSRALENAFATLADRYYIDLAEEPIIRVGKDAITAKFPFDKEL